MPEDLRLLEAKAIPVTEVIARLGIARLQKSGCEMIGPCPLCGGRDRFGINLRSNAFLCRRCDIRGGDQVALVQAILGCDFKGALEWLCGSTEVNASERARRLAAARRAAEKQARDSERYRQAAIEDARGIWDRAKGASLKEVKAYLAARGVAPDPWPGTLRALPDHPYVRKFKGEGLVTLHRGPALIAKCDGSDGHGSAVHQTWIDAARPGKKAVVQRGDEDFPSKMVRGSAKGAAIRLVQGDPGNDTLVMGEGIETTLSAWAAHSIPGAAFWAGISDVNMCGRRLGRGSAVPDLEDTRAFVPPSWVRRLVFIQDGDSDPKSTRAKMEAGLRRAMALRPGLVAQLVDPGEGVDLNDVLMR
ncbi:MAG: hypothetical protein AAGI03_01995 [Pseudomonadota bacterium]